jgi:hypothetical protein
MLQVPTKYFEVGPFAALERTVDPNDVTRLNADGNFITELIALFLEFPWFAKHVEYAELIVSSSLAFANSNTPP